MIRKDIIAPHLGHRGLLIRSTNIAYPPLGRNDCSRLVACRDARIIGTALRKSYVRKVTDVCEVITNVLIAPSGLRKARSMDNPNGTGITNGMEYRGVEYSVVQGVERGKWTWSLSLDTNTKQSGQASNRPAAVTKAERAIDRALAPKKKRLVPPGC
jgi:hypothetical protein